MKTSSGIYRRSLPIALLASVAAFPLILGSCAVHENKRDLAPGYSSSKIASLKSFYVRKDEQDDDNLGQDIADELNGRGFRASAGTTSRPPSKVDAIITYNDKWVWDVTMYMLSLDLQLREPASDAVSATAKTTRTSLIRKSQKEMVRETVSKLIEN